MHLMENSQRGSSLISVLVAVGIAGILTTGVSSILTQALRGQERVTQSSELTAIRQTLLARTNCALTLAPVPTACNGAVALKDKNGKVLVDVAGTKIGKWTLKATCVPTTDLPTNPTGGDHEIVVWAARPTNSGYFTDPLTKKDQNFANPQGRLYPYSAGLCTTFFPTSAATPFCSGPNSTARTGDKGCNAAETLTAFDVTSGQICCGRTYTRNGTLTQTFVAGAPAFATGTARCDGTDFAVSGGGQCTMGQTGVSTASYRTADSGGWIFNCAYGGLPPPATARVYANCVPKP